MTRKHFELLASIMKAHIAAEQLAGSSLNEERLLVHLLQHLLSNHTRFDQRRFIKACGL